jgi:hypothetical protein
VLGVHKSVANLLLEFYLNPFEILTNSLESQESKIHFPFYQFLSITLKPSHKFLESYLKEILFPFSFLLVFFNAHKIITKNDPTQQKGVVTG